MPILYTRMDASLLARLTLSPNREVVPSSRPLDGWLVIPLVFDTSGVLWRNETHAEPWRPFWTRVFRSLFPDVPHWALTLDYARSNGSTVAVSHADTGDWPWPECQETYCRPLVLLATNPEGELTRQLETTLKEGWSPTSGMEVLHEPMYDRVAEWVPEGAIGYLGGFGEEFAFGFFISGDPLPTEAEFAKALTDAAPSEPILRASTELVQQIENQDFLSLNGHTGRILFG